MDTANLAPEVAFSDDDVRVLRAIEADRSHLVDHMLVTPGRAQHEGLQAGV